jgi:nucleotide-binding universal stress UspA family protein
MTLPDNSLDKEKAMFEKIILLLDGSEIAEVALPYGEEFSERFGSEIILSHLCNHELLYCERMPQAYLQAKAGSFISDVKEYQSKDVKVDVTTLVQEGKPAEDIANFIEKNNINLVIMAISNTSGIDLVEHICRIVPIPVLVIKQDIRTAGDKNQLINRVLLPLDGSELSKIAIPVAEEIASRLKAPINLFQMVHINYQISSEDTSFINYEELDRDTEKIVRAEMNTIAEELKKKAIPVDVNVISGFNAAGDILTAGKQSGSDLIVMTTHGRSGLKRLVFGSVAENILKNGDIPLLLVPARAAINII